MIRNIFSSSNGKNTKGQGLPLNTVIIAVLAILVLIIIASILVPYFSRAPDTIQGCWASGGTCFNDSREKCYKSSPFSESGIDTSQEYIPRNPEDIDKSCEEQIKFCCPKGYATN